MEAALIRMLVAQSQVVEMQDWFAIYLCITFGSVALAVAFAVAVALRERKAKDEQEERRFPDYFNYRMGIGVSLAVLVIVIVIAVGCYAEILQIRIAPEVWAVKKAATILQGF